MKKLSLFTSITLSLLFSCFFAVSAFGDYQTALKADNSGDYTLAVQKYLPLAKAGNLKSQVNLGYIYLFHVQNYQQALKWFKSAAKHGSGAAYNNLGYMHRKGLGMQCSNKKAFYYYKRGARLGSKAAQENLAVIYLQGIGVQKNYKLGEKWMERAAKSGSIGAMYNLGLLHQDENNTAKAILYYKMAANTGLTQAMNKLGFIYELGQGGIPKNYQKAYHWFTLAANHGNKEAQNALKILKQKMKKEGISQATWKKAAEEKAKKAKEKQQQQQKQNQALWGNPKTK